jgi:enoyl-CoA hydratase/carnithine racemase
MTDLVLDTFSDGIRVLTLNNPALRNPISDPAMIEQLCAALSAADEDIRTRVVILTATGSVFSSGGNIASMKVGGGLNDALAAQTRRNYRYGIQRLPRLFEQLEVPVIAAVNGPAAGAGCDLACMCDIRIAAESARFAESFVKLGIVPGDGGAWLLQRLIGYSRAAELSFTGEAIEAQEALACGLVSQVVPDAELMNAALSIAQRIAVNPPHAVRMTKRLMRDGGAVPLSALLETSAAFQALAHQTQDHHEAVEAFFQKRAPTFSGS